MFFRPLKITAVIFSFTLIMVFSIGSYFLHTAYLKNYKTEFKHYISNHKAFSSVSFLAINPSELYCNSARVTWEDENTEIVYNGTLYDVVSIKNNGLTVELEVVSDEQEEEIKKRLASLYNINSHGIAKDSFDLLKGFFALKYIVHTTGVQFNSLTISNGSYQAARSFKPNNKAIQKDSPPPDLFL